MKTKDKNPEPKLVIIGGGSGSSNLIKALKQHTSNISVIVTMFDSGGSSGLLRREFGFPPFGDLRQCLLALGEDTPEVQTLRKALDFRFDKDSSLSGHSMGNLLLAAMTTMSNDVERAITDLSALLRVTGRVIPVTLDFAELCANLVDGRVITGESDIDLREAPYSKIDNIFLDRAVTVNPKAVEAIMEADAVILAPGDLYTSILPNLLADGMVDALAASGKECIYVCNLMTKRGETDGFAASDFAKQVASYLKPASLGWAVINSNLPDERVLSAYTEEQAYPVIADLSEVRRHARGVYYASLASDDLPLRHDASKTANAIMHLVNLEHRKGVRALPTA